MVSPTRQGPAEVLTRDNEEWSGILKLDSAGLPMSLVACEVATNALLQQAWYSSSNKKQENSKV